MTTISRQISLTLKNILFLTLIVFIGSCQSSNLRIYVSTDGVAQNPGTEEAPLQTLEQALSVAKKWKMLNPGGAVSISLRQGTYYPDEPIVISAEFSGTEKAPFTISAYPGEKVTISGARPLDLSWQKTKQGLLTAPLHDVLPFDQLFINGKKQIRARYPNYDPDILVYNGFAPDAISPERIKTWSRPQAGILHAMHRAEWGDYHYRIIGVDGAGEAILEGGYQNNRQMGMHNDYRFIENIKEELDVPGEWYYDEEEKLLYYMPETSFDPFASLVEVATMKHLIVVKGTEAMPVHDLKIDNLTFQHTSSTYMLTREPLLRSDWAIYRGGALLIEGTKNIHITNNYFTDLGGNAVFVNKYNRNTNISTNHFQRIGASGICFVGSPEAVRSPSFEYHQYVPYEDLDRTPGPKTNDYPSEAIVYDNLIHDIGTIEKQVAGIQISMASEINVKHNSIYNVPRAGINISEGTWGGHIIEFNDVFNTVLETGDHGSFNSWGRDRFWHPNREKMDEITALEPSLILLDAQRTTIIRNNRFRCDHGWDIDLDDGSSNYHLYNNLCLNGGIKLREGFHRTVENNIMVNNSFHPHVWFGNSHDIFRKNIVSTWYKPIRIESWGDTVDFNLLPDSAALAQSRSLGLDVHGNFGNPEYVSPETGDFSVEENSPALQLGFKNFPMDQFGVVSEQLKTLADTPEIPVLFIEAFQKIKTASFEFLGALVRNVEGIGDRSAAGLENENGILVIDLPVGSLAKNQGLLINDVILELNGLKTTNVKQLMESFQGERWKGHVELVVVRNQNKTKVSIKL